MRIKFNKAVVGDSLPEVYGIGKQYKIFRNVEIQKNKKEPEGWFIVRFTLENMSVQKNRLFSRIPMLVLFLFKGFRSKYWLMDEETNTCMGVYRWQTRRDAERYSSSIAMKFMTKRSKEGSVQFEVGEGAQPVCTF